MAKPSIQPLIAEARDRLSPAAQGLSGLANLLSGGTDVMDCQQLYYLLQPIEAEVNAALDCIKLADQPE
jgi:hypothetical protein